MKFLDTHSSTYSFGENDGNAQDEVLGSTYSFGEDDGNAEDEVLGAEDAVEHWDHGHVDAADRQVHEAHPGEEHGSAS